MYYATTAYPSDVLAFDDTTTRDKFVAGKPGRQAITRKQITSFIKAPQPFSGQYRGIDRDNYNLEWFSGIDGCVGLIDLCIDGSMERFNK